MIRGILAAVAAVVACAPAGAEVPVFCSSGCLFNDDNPYIPINGSIPDDGVPYLWTFTANDPAVTIALSGPGQVEAFQLTYGGKFIYSYKVDYLFEQTVAPGITTILVRSPKSFNRCDQPGPADEICASNYDVLFNNSFMSATGFGPEGVVVTGTAVAVPEPASWALMIAGFGLAGAALRQRAQPRPGLQP